MTFFYDLNQRMAKLAEKQNQQDAKQVVESTAPKGKLATALFEDSEKWIQKAVNPKTKGNLHKALHVPQGETIPKSKIAKATHSKNPKLRHMAQFAKNVAKEDTTDEGNEFSGNLAKAKAQHKDEFEVDGKKYKVVEADPTGLGEEEMDEGFAEMDAWLKSREKSKGTGRFDKKKISTGTVYTRKPETFDDPETDPEATGGAPKRVGRPKSAKPKDTERVTKHSHKYKMQGGKRIKKDKEAHGKMHEDGIPITDRGEYNDEAGMTKDSLHTIVRSAKELEHALRSNENMPEWVQEKIGQIKGMMSSVTDYILSSHERHAEHETGEEGITMAENANVGNIRLNLTEPQAAILLEVILGSYKSKSHKEYIRPITAQIIGQGVTAGYDKRTLKQYGPSQQGVAEKAVSVAQRRAAGIAHAAQKGEIPKKELRGASKEMAKMGKSELHKYAATKEKGLPTKVKEEGKPDFLDLDKDGNKIEPMKQAAKQSKGKGKKEEVDETTTSGSVATATTTPKASKGMQFGKGVYESINTKVEGMIAESMNVTVNMSTDEQGQAQKSITVTATDEDADKLAELLKMAGLEQKQEVCPACGSSDCGCGDQMVDENSPDWPTKPEYTQTKQSADPISNDLLRDKSTGQTTIPVVASQLRRQVSMEENVELERTLFKTWKNYKG